jgi:outer membrane biosynthesis protein TonB
MAFAVPLLTTALSTTAGKVAAGAVGGVLGASLMGRSGGAAAPAAPPPAPAPVVTPPTPVPPPPPAPVVAPQPAPVAAPAPAPTPASKPAPTEGAAAPAIPVSTGIGSTAASGGRAETAAIMAEAAGPAEEEAARTASRGRRSTIATGPQGILGTSGARAARSLVGGGGLIR